MSLYVDVIPYRLMRVFYLLYFSNIKIQYRTFIYVLVINKNIITYNSNKYYISLS